MVIVATAGRDMQMISQREEALAVVGIRDRGLMEWRIPEILSPLFERLESCEKLVVEIRERLAIGATSSANLQSAKKVHSVFGCRFGGGASRRRNNCVALR